MPNILFFYEPPLDRSFSGNGFGLNAGKKASGWVRSQISNLVSDKYGTSEFLAFLDSDVILTSYAIEDILFQDKKPRIFCTQHRDLGMARLRDIFVEFKHLNPFRFFF